MRSLYPWVVTLGSYIKGTTFYKAFMTPIYMPISKYQTTLNVITNLLSKKAPIAAPNGKL